MTAMGLLRRNADRRFALLVLGSLACVIGFGWSRLSGGTARGGDHREIDRAAVRAKLQTGDLVRHEALYYHRGAEEP